MGDTTTVLVIGGAAVVVLLVLVVLLALTSRQLIALRTGQRALETRVDELAALVEPSRPHREGGPRRAPGPPDEPGVILVPEALPPLVTGPAPGAEDRVEVPDRIVLSATLGEPLVKAVALGHGVRRALSAESRNRIRFEVRREVRRARKSRRQQRRAALRRLRAEGVQHL